jgi:hypothetical protein
MSLESCPICGYALSIVGSRCRHCTPSFGALPSSRPFDAKFLPQIIGVVVVLSVLAYLIFFR